jgi:tetratricopeptide (TPR) repeat protein
LSETLGGLPLAHEQAAAYCERLDMSLAEYRRRFEATPARHLDAERDAPADYYDRLTVAKTFALAIDEAAKLHAAAEPLIVCAALLAPEPIPLFLFSEAREKFGEPLASRLAGDGLDEALAALRSFALVDHEMITDERDPVITTDCIRLHRLVRQVAAMRCQGEACEAVRRTLIEALVAVYPEYIWHDPQTWPRCRRLDALALGLVGDDLPSGAGERAAELLIFAGQYRQYCRAAYAEAKPLFERVVAISEKVLGPENPGTAISLSNLALLLKAQDDLAGARPLYERALAIDEKVLGPEHHEIARDLSNLGRLLSDLEQTDKAEPLLRRAIAIGDKALGTEHPLTRRYQSNYACLLLTTSRAAEALALAEAALATHERVNGPNHSWTKDSARVAADAFDALGRGEEATTIRTRYGIETRHE